MSRADLQARFEQMLRLADSFSVDLVGQPPFCANMRTLSPRETVEHAESEGFSAVPLIASGDDTPSHIVAVAGLRQLGDSWPRGDLPGARRITAGDLIPGRASLFRALDRLVRDSSRPFLLTLSDDGAPALLVTVYDVDQPAARMVAFGLTGVVEAGIGSLLRAALLTVSGERERLKLIEAARDRLPNEVPAVYPSGPVAKPRSDVTAKLNAWHAKCTGDENLDLVNSLSLATKAHLLGVLSMDGETCLSTHARIAGLSPAQAYDELRRLNELRNDTAHDRKEIVPTAQERCSLIARAHVLAERYAQSTA